MDQTDNQHILRNNKTYDKSQIMCDYAQLNLDSYCDFNDLKNNGALRQENEIFSDKERKETFSLEDRSLPKYSPEILQKSSSNMKSVNDSDVTVNVSKLIYQLFNAKVVIKRMCENTETKEQFTNNTASNRSQLFRSSIQRYCPKCQTMTVDTHSVSLKKSCSMCKSTLVYLCFKCNSKQYLSYQKLKAHWNTCRAADSGLEDLNQPDFLVEKSEIDFSKAIIRYCSNCNEIDSRCGKWVKRLCRYCDIQLLYQCNKCKAQYNSYDSLRSHMHSKCYPTRYKCNRCVYTSPVWDNMRQHVISLHLRVHSNIEPPTQVLNAKANFKKLENPLADNTLSQTAKVPTNVNPVDENGSADEDNSFLDRSQFILKEFESVSSTEKWIRYCPKCRLVSASLYDRQCTCSKNLLYMCKKCNVKCNSRKNMVYHSESRCFPAHQYKCTNCNYSTTLWRNMQLHFRLVHTNLPPIKCEFCSFETKLKCHLTVHTKRKHGEINKLFHCNSCSYSTKYEINLQRHGKLNH